MPKKFNRALLNTTELELLTTSEKHNMCSLNPHKKSVSISLINT